ncbi:DUF397 domain-containing protein [Plantactinospora sp. B6F1]|uniref:DUF397 domain-containing protein n=1 Tax=Plantactinospora sp. B6F1 TaxID=3158971 RepID=UPI0032D8EB41
MLDNQWRKSTRSGSNGACVEARHTGQATEVRDNKDKAGPVLTFTPAAWRAFVRHIR